MSRVIDDKTIEALANSVYDMPEHNGKLLPKLYVVNQVCSKLNNWSLLDHVDYVLSHSNQFVSIKGPAGGFGRTN